MTAAEAIEQEKNVYSSLVAGADCTVVLIDHTVALGSWFLNENWLEHARPEFSTLRDDTLASFKERNQESVALPQDLSAGTGVVLVSQEELDQLDSATGSDRDEFWTAFEANYGTNCGYHSFSRAGFSEDGRQALVYLSSLCGSLCGGGELILLERGAQGYAVVERVPVWIA
jgi:hypothetical protein